MLQHAKFLLCFILLAGFAPSVWLQTKPAAKVSGGLGAEAKAAVARDQAQGDDPQVRRVALNALGGRAGTVVVMNPKSGRVYTIVNQDWGARRAFKPCSVVKLVTGLAGLSENLVVSAGSATIGGKPAPYTFSRALAGSHNGFFENLGAEVGAAGLLRYARDLGLGQRTGINLAGESAGRVPAGVASVRQLSSHGKDLLVTPLQLAALVSAIANGGSLLTPQFGSDAPRVRRRLNAVSLASLREMLPGLAGAVQLGTGRAAYDPANRVAGKTGTCTDQDGWLGIFASFAPVANPRLSVVVLLRGQGANGGAAAAIAGSIYRSLKGRFGASNRWVAGVPSYAAASVSAFPKRLSRPVKENKANSSRHIR